MSFALPLIVLVVAFGCGGGSDGARETCTTPDGYPESLRTPLARPLPLPCDAQPNFVEHVKLLRWADESLPLVAVMNLKNLPSSTYLAGAPLEPSLLADAARRVHEQMSLWEEPLGIDFFAEPILYRETTGMSPPDGAITLSWRTGSEGSSIARTRIEFETETGIILAADVEIDGRTSLQLGEVRALDLLRHEIGHALGVSGHSPDERDVMYPTVRACSAARSGSMTEADANTLAAAYCDRSTLESAAEAVPVMSWAERRRRLTERGARIVAEPDEDGHAVVEWQCH